MIKEFIGTGKTVDAAMAAAKAGLGAPLTADVHIEVIETPKKKFLGLFGTTDAKVKASYDDGVKEKKAKKRKKQEPKKQDNKSQEPKKQNGGKPAQKKAQPKQQKPAKQEAPAKDKEHPKSVDLDAAKAYVAQILDSFKVQDAKIDAAYSAEEGVVTINIDCDDCGIIIGHHGDTLDSIQYLLSLIMKKSAGGYVRVSINVGDFKEKRAETLQNMARKGAAYVQRTGRAYKFDPMNPYERRILHTTVQEIEGIESRSIGHDQERRVVLEPVGGVKPRSGGNRRGGRGPRPTAPQVDPNREQRVDRADLPKFGKIEINKD